MKRPQEPDSDLPLEGSGYIYPAGAAEPVQNGGAAEASEHLMAVVVDPEKPDFGLSVKNRSQPQIQPPFPVAQMPGLYDGRGLCTHPQKGMEL